MTNEQLKIIGHRVRIISKSSSHKGEYGIVTGTTKNRDTYIRKVGLSGLFFVCISFPSFLSSYKNYHSIYKANTQMKGD